MSLSNVLGRPSAFNLVGFNNKPTLLGSAYQNGTCSDTSCDGNTIYGDNLLLGLKDLHNDFEWVEVFLRN